MEPLTPLDDDARALLSAYRGRHPGAPARARNWAGVQQRVAAPARRRSPLVIGAAAFALAAAFLLLVRGLSGVWQASRGPSSPPPAALDERELPRSEPIVVPPPPPAVPPAVLPTPPMVVEHDAPVPVQRPSVQAPAHPTRSIAEEVELIAAARAAMVASSWTRALELLDDHAQRFELGVLAEERAALRAITLCRLDAGAADAAVRSFDARYPGSHHHRSITLACTRDENRATP